MSKLRRGMRVRLGSNPQVRIVRRTRRTGMTQEVMLSGHRRHAGEVWYPQDHISPEDAARAYGPHHPAAQGAWEFDR